MDDEEVHHLTQEAISTRVLDLSARCLEALPPQSLACGGLLVLNLSGNALKSLPHQLGELVCLLELDVSFNKLQSLPPCIGSLQQLTRLEAAYNQLTELSPEVGSCTALEYLGLHDNLLQQLPGSLGQLHHLTELQLQYNQLTGLPLELGTLSSLKTLQLEGNPLQQPALLQLAEASVTDEQGLNIEALQRALAAQPMATQRASCTTSVGTSSSGGGSKAHGAGAAPGHPHKAPNILILDGPEQALAQQMRISPRSPKLTAGPADEVADESEEEEAEGSGRGVWQGSGALTAHNQDASAGSAVGLAMELSMQDMAELPPAAAAVLYRTLDSVRNGVQEMQEGRPLTRGGSAGMAPGTAAALVSAHRPATSSQGRPGSAAYRPYSASRPGTSRPVSASASRPTSAQASGGAHRLGSPLLVPGQEARPKWLPQQGGVMALLGGNRPGSSGAGPSEGAGALQRPGSSWGVRAEGGGGRAAVAADAHAGSSSGSAFEELPPITFPLTAGVRSMMQRMSVKKRAEASQEEGKGAACGDNASTRTAGRGQSGVPGPSSADAAAAGAGAAGGGDDDDEALVRNLLLARRPELLHSFQEALTDPDPQDGGVDEGGD